MDTTTNAFDREKCTLGNLPLSSTRTLKLPDGASITYQLDRRSRKTLGLKITENGLEVHAPKLLLIKQIEALIKDKARWIQEKLSKQADNKIPPISWQDKESLLYLGQDIALCFKTHQRNQAAKLHGQALQLNLIDHSSEMVQRKVIQWYQKQALKYFSRRLSLFAHKLGVPTPPLSLSNAKTRWGSCNSRGQIRLSWRLMQAPPEMINYVVCHELAHLKEMNHSPRFYAVLEGLMPNHRQVEKALDHFTPQLRRI